MNYYIADLHFGHENVIRFDGRPFKDVDEMDQVMITQWNAVVSEKDDVYILGDFCFKSSKGPLWYLRQLKGRKHLILGNHDTYLLQNDEVMKEFASVDKMTYVKDGEYTLVLCHFPIAEWNHYHREMCFHVYGHIHNNKDGCFDFLKDEYKALNAGCMINHFTPVTIDQLITNNKEYKKEGIFIDQENVRWTFSEWFRAGLIYHFYINGQRDHEHNFEAVMVTAYEEADTFEIREEDKHEYSRQELEYLKTIVEKTQEII